MYNKGQEYEIKYITSEGKENTTNITPEKDMSIPEMILKLKEEDENFFKLIENKIIKKEDKNMKTLYDAMEERKFEDIDIADDENGDLVVAFCLDPENGDSDSYDRVLTKIAKELEVYEVQEDVIICKVSDWVRKHKEVLSDLFEEDDEDYLVGTAFPGIISGYITDDAYNELDNKLNESKEIKTEADSRGESIEKEVEINGIGRTLYWQAEENCFNTMLNTIHGLEKYVTNWNIDFMAGRSSAYIEFGSISGQSQFKAEFDTETFGKVKSVETTYSNQEVTSEFVQLASLMNELKS